MISENTPAEGSKEYFVDLTSEHKEALHLVEIQTSLARLSDTYKQSQQLNDRFEGYTFTGDLNNSGILLTAELPRAIQSWVQNGMTLLSAEIDFIVGPGEHASTGIVVTFNLQQDATVENGEQNIIVRSTHGVKEKSTVTKIDLDTEKIKHDEFDVIDENEAYAFIVSIASRNNNDLVLGYLSKQNLFREHLHNPFSLSDIHTRLDPLATTSRHETYHRLHDPTTSLDIDLTLAHIDEEFVAIEAELWDDQEKSNGISVSMSATQNAPASNEDDEYECFFGTKRPRLAKHFEESPLRFMRDGSMITPNLNDLEEITERLAAMVEYTTPAEVTEAVVDYDKATGEMNSGESDEYGLDATDTGA